MALSNVVIYNTEIQDMTIELVDQMVADISARSNGAIQLTSVRLRGDYDRQTFWQNLSAARRRVDRNAANGVQASTDLQQLEEVGVKIAGGFGPVLLEPSQMTWLQESPVDAIAAISRYSAESIIQDQLNTSVAAAVAAIENQPTLVNDVSGGAVLSQAAINGAHAKFGDMSQMLVAQVMNGATYHQLVGEAITNNNRLFVSTNIQMVDILGKVVVVTDAPALQETGAPDKLKVLSLCAGGLMMSDNADLVTNLETNNGKERIETTWQADYSFNTKIKGYQWDIANGGSSPDDATIATGSNWNKVKLDKFTAGTLAVGDLG